MTRHPLLRFLAAATACQPCQRLIEKQVRFSLKLMGIGSGGSVASSGESGIIDRIPKCRDRPLCIFDVGANTGEFLALLHRKLGNRPFHAHAFEPGQSAYSTLAHNWEASAQVTLNLYGLGREPGECSLFYDYAGSGLASLSKRNLDHAGIAFYESEVVKIDTLDSYCSAGGIRQIDLLKIDVEGHELDVLQGGPELFRRRMVGMVSFEFGGCNIDTRTYFKDFFTYFQDNGMDVFRVTPTGYLMPIPAYREILEQFRTTNFVAVLRG